MVGNVNPGFDSLLREQIERYRTAYQQRDVDQMLSLFADGAQCTAAPGTFRGKDAIRRFYEWDARVSPTATMHDGGVGVLVVGQTVVWERTLSLSYEGISFDERAVAIVEFDDQARITSLRSYYDKLADLDQIASKSPGISGWIAKKVVGYLVGAGSKGLALENSPP